MKTATASSAPTLVLERLRTSLEELLRGKEEAAEVILCALLASGHVLFEDVPGVGKTTLIKAIAKLLGLDISRVQCTSDLLPSDILGVEVFSPTHNTFVFHPGPIFSSIVFVDELNRASPRTQSALLEAMAEGAVTYARQTHPLPKPFLLFATQNPSDALGTYPLPESQLDRFAAKLRLHYPTAERERMIFASPSLEPESKMGSALFDKGEFASLQAAAEGIHISEKVTAYVRRFLEHSRRHEGLRLGISTRGGVLWLRMARARALLLGRDYVLPDDLLAIAEACLAHRVIARAGNETNAIIQHLKQTVPVESNVL